MATTKSDLVRSALKRLAVTGFDYEIDPEELKSGVITLEQMMAAWDARGIKAGYQFADNPETADINADAGVPDIAFMAITCSLAMELADTYGKVISQNLAMSAASGMNSLLAAIQHQPQMQYPSRMPRGSGNTLRNWRWRRFYRETDTMDADNSGPMTTNEGETLQP